MAKTRARNPRWFAQRRGARHDAPKRAVASSARPNEGQRPTQPAHEGNGYRRKALRYRCECAAGECPVVEVVAWPGEARRAVPTRRDATSAIGQRKPRSETTETDPAPSRNAQRAPEEQGTHATQFASELGLTTPRSTRTYHDESGPGCSGSGVFLRRGARTAGMSPRSDPARPTCRAAKIELHDSSRARRSRKADGLEAIASPLRGPDPVF